MENIWVVSEDPIDCIVSLCTDLNTVYNVLDEMFDKVRIEQCTESMGFWKGIHRRDKKFYSGDFHLMEVNEPAKGWE